MLVVGGSSSKEDILPTVNFCHKQLLERCVWNFQFLSKNWENNLVFFLPRLVRVWMVFNKSNHSFTILEITQLIDYSFRAPSQWQLLRFASTPECNLTKWRQWRCHVQTRSKSRAQMISSQWKHTYLLRNCWPITWWLYTPSTLASGKDLCYYSTCLI